MMLSKRALQTALGILWLVDGLLQLQPKMFTKEFISQVILPNAQSQPSWITDSIQWMADVVSPHIGIFNILFAGIQLLIGLALVCNVRVKTALRLSFIWSFIVWWFGEGFGQLFTGHALVLTGVPGAALLYTLVGWCIWPDGEVSTKNDSKYPGRTEVARYCLGTLWVIGAVLQFQSAYLTPTGIASDVSVGWVANAIDSHGALVSIGLAVVEFVIGFGLLFSQNIRPIWWASCILSVTFWWVGQSFGQLFTGLGTDPNTGPVLILLLLCVSWHSSHFPIKIQSDKTRTI
jgi:hypothetical protein